jgi:hypothetical protein
MYREYAVKQATIEFVQQLEGVGNPLRYYNEKRRLCVRVLAAIEPSGVR